MARLIMDGVSDEFKERVLKLAKKKGVSYKELILSALEKVEGIRDHKKTR